MYKKIVSFMLVVCFLMVNTGISYASEGENDITVRDNKNIDRDKIEKMYERQNKKMTNQVEIKINSNKNEKEILLENLNEILKLSAQNVQNSYEKKVISNKINRLYKDIGALESVIKIDDQEVLERAYSVEDNRVEGKDDSRVSYMSKPVVPSGGRYLDAYGITSYTTYNGKQYQVFEIIVYTTDINNPRSNPLLYKGSVDLLASGDYEVSDFAEDVVCVSNYVAGLVSVPYAVISTIMPPSEFFGTGASQSLRYNYRASQMYVFAYVSERSYDSFTHMQTSERLSVASTVEVAAVVNGTVYQKNKDCGTQVILSNKFADVNEPTKRFSQGYINYKTYRIGDLDVEFDGDYKGKVNTYYYYRIDTIPGL